MGTRAVDFCPECEKKVAMNKDGSLRKHPCNPAEAPVAPEEVVEPAVPAVDATIPKFRIG